METLKFTAYSFIASALINNDTSGLDKYGLKYLEEVKRFLILNDFPTDSVVDASEEFFTWSPDCGNVGGTVCTFTAMKQPRKE